MVGLIEEIQLEAINPSSSITVLLRKVKLAAAKLNLKDVITWVDTELKGVTNAKEAPEYRKVTGDLRNHSRFHPPQPVMGNPDVVDMLSSTVIYEPISAIESSIANATDQTSLSIKLNSHLQDLLRQANNTNHVDVRIHFGLNVLVAIVDSVRGLILDWAIDLEKRGIHGEGISFSMEEKAKAAAIASSITITHFSGQLHQGDVGGSNKTLVGSSVDNSITLETGISIFSQALTAAQNGIAEDNIRNEVAEIIKEMETKAGSPDYLSAFNRYVGYAADYSTVLGPYIAPLAALIGHAVT